MSKRATYITHPQRIYDNPLNPNISDYVEVIPKTTTDAVIVEGSNQNLTEILSELGTIKCDVRNTTVLGEDVVRISESVGKNIATAGNAISSGEYNDVVSYLGKAFDGKFESSNMWWSKQVFKGGSESNPDLMINGKAYIGNRNLSEKVTQIKLYQPPYQSSCVSSVKVQISKTNDDNWEDLQTYSLEVKDAYSTPNTLNLPDYTVSAPYSLRVLANSDVYGTSTGTSFPCWQVVELELIVGGSGVTLQVGNMVVAVANGFDESGAPIDNIVKKVGYIDLQEPAVGMNYLVLDIDGNYEYVNLFDGGRDFPENPIDSQIYFHDQLRKAFKYESGQWVEYPCSAIAKFNNGKLDAILPFNTWWWDEIELADVEPDFPVGLELDSYTDGTTNYLRINKGSLIKDNTLYKLSNTIYKQVGLPFVYGDKNGSNDGSYTNIYTNIVPENITSSSMQGYIITGNSVSNYLNSFNPNINTSQPYCSINDIPASIDIILPNSLERSVNKYTIEAKSLNNDSNYFVNSWVLLGTLNGKDWEVIDSRKNESFSGQSTKEYYPENNKSYNRIKLLIQGTVGNNNTGSIGQIRFYESVPNLKVFVITDGSVTDILTSKYSSPILPSGYTSYHQIGILNISDSGLVTKVFPTRSVSIDIVDGYRYIADQVDKKANSEMNNLSSSAMDFITGLYMPVYSSESTKGKNVIYKAPRHSMLIISHTGNIQLFVSENISDVEQNSANRCVYQANVTSLTTTSVIVAKNSFYKATGGGSITRYVEVPLRGGVL